MLRIVLLHFPLQHHPTSRYCTLRHIPLIWFIFESGKECIQVNGELWTESLESSPGSAADEYVSNELGAKITCLNWSRSGSPWGSMKLRSKRNIFSFNCLNIQFLKILQNLKILRLDQCSVRVEILTECKMYLLNLVLFAKFLRILLQQQQDHSRIHWLLRMTCQLNKVHLNDSYYMSHIIWLSISNTKMGVKWLSSNWTWPF